jgi:hypothetical protein
MIQKLNHTPCIMKQIVQPPIACNIGLEANYILNVSENVPILHGHVSQCFFPIMDVVPFIHVHLDIF